MAEADWLNPPGIDQRTLFEGNSILRGGRDPLVRADQGAAARGPILIE